ncbi:MAG: MBL fold metallo-hydrolase [Phycisphaerae bacterium]
MAEAQLLFLGSGTSHGVPMIGCDCEVCRSSDQRDRRFRSGTAILLPPGPPTDGRVILIDVAPEFRLAAIANRLARVDAILFTHAHADHIMGMDDIRRYNEIIGGPIQCFGDERTIQIVRRNFAYTDRPYRGDGWPTAAFNILDSRREVCGVTVQPIPLLHGPSPVLGYRVGTLAYCTDCSEIPSASRPLLEGLDVLVIDGLRYTPHPTHLNIPGALAAIAEIRPRRAILTHITHQVSHARTSAELPPGVELAYDGLRVTFTL